MHDRRCIHALSQLYHSDLSDCLRHLPEAEREPRLFMKSVWSELHAEWQRGDYFLAVGLRGEQGELADSQTTSSAYMIIIAACGTANGDADSPSSAMPWVIHTAGK